MMKTSSRVPEMRPYLWEVDRVVVCLSEADHPLAVFPLMLLTAASKALVGQVLFLNHFCIS